MTLEDRLAALKLGILKAGVTLAKAGGGGNPYHDPKGRFTHGSGAYASGPPGSAAGAPRGGQKKPDPNYRAPPPRHKIPKKPSPIPPGNEGKPVQIAGHEPFNPHHYTAHAHDRDGSTRHTTKQHPTREEAVAAAWKAHPKAHRVSSGRGYGGSFDIRSHPKT